MSSVDKSRFTDSDQYAAALEAERRTTDHDSQDIPILKTDEGAPKYFDEKEVIPKFVTRDKYQELILKEEETKPKIWREN